MGWKKLKSLGPKLLNALAVFFAALGAGFIFFAENADTAAPLVWTVKALAGASIGATITTAAAAVAVSIPPGIKPKRSWRVFLRVFAAFVTVTALLFAGWYVGSLVSSLAEPNQPRTSRVYAKELSAVLAHIERERASAYKRLSKVDSGKPQARIATALAESLAERATAIRAIQMQSDEREATLTIATRIEKLSVAYSGLAAATINPKGSQKALERARHRVDHASKQLRASGMALAVHGYEIVAAGLSGRTLHSGSQSS